VGSAVAYVVQAGQVAYDVALRWQDQLVAARQADLVDDVVLLLTHPPVYTAGRHADLAANLTGARPDIPVVRVDRGGDVTYHGPGQVVAYPIVRLPQRGAAKAHVTALEQALVDVAATYGVTAARRSGYPGVWVGRDKLAAVGVRITRGVSKHGVALNVEPDLADFDGIVPCGIADGGVTSLARLGVTTSVEDAQVRLGAALCRALDRIPQPARPHDLGLG
jgi:lipoyl(octanoyl) transferase